ncbi:PRC and DUF2382 domain-containing protein [Corynebacterium auriscanis]|uniref:PRC and DUF2382 domain-containing protein n=1 Tax=Corynebacterium TaxID=1716 RepID=UPI0008A30961|nr:PRC and DUF2382 domain-containing protein [Corynebacterium sp. HMSC28B08]OFT88722.1 photosystem reaction center subunit H [Corynebacterium sp. HMSC28B08]
MSNIKDLFNATAYDNTGDKLGSVKEVFVDDNSGQPTFVEVNHGLFGMNSSLVPLRGHKFDGKDLNLAFAKDRIKDAPNLDADQALTPDQQNEVLRHYGVDGLEDQTRYEGVQGSRTERDRGVHTEGAEFAGRDRADLNDRDRVATNDGEMIRSEEQLDVSKERVATGEARLRKYVVTDSETVEVPVTREEVRVERTPINADDAANHNARIGEEEASVTLHEERVDVSKNTVPVEKVNLGKQQVTETERHTEELRKERIDVDGVEGVDPRDERR